ncbi:putative callose synthase 8 [Chenopodium quinoa]|uniref:putative callose synthase 8 n=1 Tax=Chenopodium quinoa TaxID=63459 RepID=UPI000B77EC81|nr:putative callose synthase 8 [Chenopodium quinoa]
MSSTSSEIVLAEPIQETYHEIDERDIPSTSSGISSRSFTRSITYGDDDYDNYVPKPFESEKLPLSLAPDIRRFLRVANQIESQEPRVAYLCRFHAFERAHNKDKKSKGRGVRQFKTALLQRLEQDMEDSIARRKEKSDIRELRRVFNGYKDYINRHTGTEEFINKDKFTNARDIASVLYEVLVAVTRATGHQVHGDRGSIDHVTYNILPLGNDGVHLPIMVLPEIKVAVAAVRNIRGLPFMDEFKKNKSPRATYDIFDWLGFIFGFQKGNVANQREHLILLLANTHIRQSHKLASVLQFSDGALDGLMRKFFKNYTKWCKFLGKKSNIRLPYVKQEAQQYKLLYIALYLLIWGEAANLRLMPECLCYIYHHMAYELHSMLTDAVSLMTWEKVMPVYGGEDEAFLKKVVGPIYDVISREAKKSNSGIADHSKWRNYDDLNEYFWSPDCFSIGWPMRTDKNDLHDFFFVNNSPANQSKKKKFPDYQSKGNIFVRFKKFIGKSAVKDEEEGILETEDKDSKNKWLGKTNFVEIRSFLQLFRSFDRMWSFLILALQALVIIACHDVTSPLQLIETTILEDLSSIFITSAGLKVVQAILEIAFTWKARTTMDTKRIWKYVLRLIIATIWAIILPVFYVNTRRKYTCYSIRPGTLLGKWCYSSYMMAVAIYLIGNAVDVILFFVPAIGRYIETSNNRICTYLSWWTQPRLFVGRGMQEDQVSSFKYMLFWVLLLLSKLSFSYYFEIKPLIEPTRQMMRVGSHRYQRRELFPHVKSNAGVLVAVWAPILLVYFMDTQIWYSVFCALFGGIYGILHHLGEIRTLGMLRSRFQLLPSAFNARLIPPNLKNDRGRISKGFFSQLKKASGDKKGDLAKFVTMWNQIIISFRQEDLINNRERDLMIMPLSAEILSGHVRWPVFLLTNEFSTALSIAKEFDGKDEDLIQRIGRGSLMYFAVKECYKSLKYIFGIIAAGELEKRIVSGIISEINESIQSSTLLEKIQLSELPALHAKCVELVELLVKGNELYHVVVVDVARHDDVVGALYVQVVKVLQDIFELVTNEMMINGSRTLDTLHSSDQKVEDSAFFSREIQPEIFASKDSIHFPLPNDGALHDKIKRFLLLLTVKDKAMDVPANLDARRRISFFATSLSMNMPAAPKVRNMLSFSVLTPHYMEEVKFSMKELLSSQEQVSIIFYMRKIYPDQWKNFLERMDCEDLNDLMEKDKEAELRDWASFRGQTLSRTVRGMMYYKKALKLQAYLDMAEDKDILQGYDAIERGNESLSAHLDALSDMKFTYVVTWQMYGTCKRDGDPRAQDMLDLMTRYPALRVAYVEETEETIADESEKAKVYSSVLVKGGINGHDQEVYRIKLPGPPNIGEGKPENQNHAIIFTRGEALQTIDMNQDNYLEEAYKMRNILQEFFEDRGRRAPTIVGLREHVFTGSVSTLAWFMSYQETSFVTIGQRILANPLRVRFHYGHPDIFDRIFHITRGGISKASKTINLSEDVFAGFNSVLRRGYVTYQEYIQVGKGRDVGLIQISKFEAKVANGNSEQTLTRDIYRLGQQFDFFRMLSCYYTTIGFYFSNLVSVISIYVFLYGQLYLVLSGLQKVLIIEARVHNVQSLETALASQSFIQLGLLTGLPMVMEIALERGFYTALKDFVLMQLQLASVFFTFSCGAKSHYYGRTILHGGAKYIPTGRKVVIFHATFSENYRLYSRSHFVKGFELLLLLTVYDLYRKSYQSSMAYVLITYAIWFLSLTWLFAPFLFNPSGFDWPIIVDDWRDWNKWIRQQGGIGIPPDKSWQSWWDDEQEHIRRSRWSSRIIEIILSLRFFVYQYGLVYQLDISKNSSNFIVYVLSWVVIGVIFLLVKIVNVGRQWLSANHQFLFRLFKACLFLAVISTIITLSLLCNLSIMDLIVCCLAFLPTGWGLILIAQALRPLIENTGIWDFAQVFARWYDFGMGVVLFAPIASFSWLPIISAFQTRFLFNEAYNRRLHILPILQGQGKKKCT